VITHVVKGSRFKVNTIAGSIDLLPTLTDLAGIRDFKTLPLDGVSLKPLLLQDGTPWPDRLYINHFKGKTSVRSQRYRLDQHGVLFDMKNDPGQNKDVSKDFPAVAKKLLAAQKRFRKDVLSELPEKDTRPFLIGDPDFDFTQIPARDGKESGNVKRSARAPNCSFFTNWKAVEDRITWDVEVLSKGNYRVKLYYTCPKKDLGSTVELSCGDARLVAKVTEANDPPLRGAENDRTVTLG